MSNTLPSASERASFRYSPWAQASGIAEPDGAAENSSRCGMSGPSQVCSGRSPPSPARRSSASSMRSASDLSPHARAWWPRSPVSSGQTRPDSGAVEGCTVRVLAVPVAVVAVPGGPVRRLHLQERVDDTDRVQDARIVRGAQPEPDERERVGAHELLRRAARLVRWTVLDGHEVVAVVEVGGRDAHVVAVDADLAGERGAAHVQPALDLVVPAVGGLTQVGCQPGLARRRPDRPRRGAPRSLPRA